MDEKEVVETIRNFIEQNKFPKECPTCNRYYYSLADYLNNTTHVGPPLSYDAEIGDWQPGQAVGTFSSANCSCGSTLVVDSGGMPLGLMWKLLRWARCESKRRGISVNELLADIRQKIDQRVLALQSAKNCQSI